MQEFRATQVIRSAKRRFAGRFLDLSGDLKKFWRNIRSFGLMSGGVELTFILLLLPLIPPTWLTSLIILSLRVILSYFLVLMRYVWWLH
jgi:hypothetical protein